jgi:hypothetical protein
VGGAKKKRIPGKVEVGGGKEEPTAAVRRAREKGRKAEVGGTRKTKIGREGEGTTKSPVEA